VNVQLAQVIVIIEVNVLKEFAIVEPDLLDLIVQQKFVQNASMENVVIRHLIVLAKMVGLDLIVHFKHVRFLVVPMVIVTMELVIANLDSPEITVHYQHAHHLVLEMVNVLWKKVK